MNPPRAADIGVSDVYASSCAGVAGVGDTTLPAGVTDTLGPVQAFTLAVYDDPSFPVAISAAAAFNIFGITGRGGDASFNVAPWTVIADIFGRAEDSGTWQTWARNLGLVTQKPVTTPTAGAGAVLAALNTSNRASAIGIIALNDIVPTGGVAPKVRPLAFKAKDQDFAYYPEQHVHLGGPHQRSRRSLPDVGEPPLLRAQGHGWRLLGVGQEGPRPARGQGGGRGCLQDPRRPELRDAGLPQRRRRRLQALHAGRALRLLLRGHRLRYCPDHVQDVHGQHHVRREWPVRLWILRGQVT